MSSPPKKPAEDAELTTAGKRAAGLKQSAFTAIEKDFSINVADLGQHWRDTTSESFFNHFTKLLKHHKHHGWETISEHLETQRTIRHNTKGKGNHRDDPRWKPKDAQNAMIELSKLESPLDDLSASPPPSMHSEDELLSIIHDEALPIDSATQSDSGSEAEDKVSAWPIVNVLYIAIPPFKNIETDGPFFNIPIYPSTRHSNGEVFENIDQDFLGRLEGWLGPGMCSQVGLKKLANRNPPGQAARSLDDEVVHLHQMLLTMWFARSTKRISLVIRPSEQVMDGSDEDAINNLVSYDQHPKMILFMPIDAMFWQQQPGLSKLYDQLHLACTSHPSKDARVYPSRSEMDHASLKLPDIEAFDRIAKNAPEKYAFRPKTCHGKGVCTLAEDDHMDNVFKGTFSTGSRHVKIGKRTDSELRKLIRCTEAGEKPKCIPSTRRADDDLPSNLPRREWFHQEYIPPLAKWELRVFMVGDKVVKIGYTSVQSPGKPEDIVCQEFRYRSHFRWLDKKSQKDKADELELFCHWWREALMKENAEQFETLKVGVRFDIGISEETIDGLFFINTASRWSSAAFFNEDLSLWPHEEMCEKIGKQFAREYGSIPRGVEGIGQQVWGRGGWGDYEYEEVEEDGEAVQGKGGSKGKGKGKQFAQNGKRGRQGDRRKTLS